jgi:hypothetical protein
VERPAVSSIARPLLQVITTLPFVISTEAQRSGATAVSSIARPLLRVITTLPFVISTEAQRSGEISVWMLFPGSVFRQTWACAGIVFESGADSFLTFKVLNYKSLRP